MGLNNLFSTCSLCGVNELFLESKSLNEIFCCILDFTSTGLGKSANWPGLLADGLAEILLSDQ